MPKKKVSDEAVEAAAKARYEREKGDINWAWDTAPEGRKQWLRTEASAILQAALPALRTQFTEELLSDEAVQAGIKAQRGAVYKYTQMQLGQGPHEGNYDRIERLTIEDVLRAALQQAGRE